MNLDPITWGQVESALEKYYNANLAKRWISDLMAKRDYIKTRRKVSEALDDVLFPAPTLTNYDKETEWHDVWDVISLALKQARGAKGDAAPLSHQELVDFKTRLLNSLDQMTAPPGTYGDSREIRSNISLSPGS